MAALKRARRTASAISFVLASLLVLSAAPANAADLITAPAPSPVDPNGIPAARFAVTEAAAAVSSTFTDVTPLTPLSTEINWMGTSGVLKPGGKFNPAGPTTRTELAVWAYKVSGSPAYTAPAVTPFKDTSTTASGYKEIAWANSKGILVAAADKAYRPTAAMTRADIAVALYRLAGKPVFTPPAASPFKDVLKTAPGYAEITWAASVGLVSGTSYGPATSARHDAVAYALNKFVTRVQPVKATAGALNVGPLGTGHASALVRLSAVKVGTETTVKVGGAPVLTVKAKTSGSTTVLVPLKDNTIPVTANTATGVSLEVLATFDGTAKTPGSTIAIAPVTRADTVKKLAGDTLSTAPIKVGLTGAGGVPSTGVRAVYATATVTIPTARVLSIGGQKLSVFAGTSSVTTVLVPEEDGTVNASIDSGAGSLRLDVRGYVPESSQNANSVNVGGSFVPAVKPTAQTAQVYGPGKASVTIPGVKDRSFAIAMVSTTPSASPSTVPGYLTLGSKTLAGLGALVDPATGGQPQLVIVPAGTAATPLSVSAGTTKATIVPVGDILSPTAGSSTSAPGVKITSPVNGSTVDLSKTGMARLEGEISGGSLSTSTVTISVAGKVIGSAIVRQTSTGARWSFDTRIAKSGNPKFDVKATDRSGRTGTASVTVKATAPSATAALVTPDAIVLDPAKPALAPTAVTPTTVTFRQAPDLRPGKVMVGGVTAISPGGELRRVTEVNKTSAGWVATTVPAKITDVLSQANINKLVPINNLTQQSISTNVKPSAGDSSGTTIAGPVKSVLIKTSPAAPRPLAQRLQAESSAVAPIVTQTLSISSGYALKNEKGKEKDLTDYSNAAPETALKTKAEAKASLGGSVETKAELELALRVVLKISPRLDWGIPAVAVDEFSVVLATTSKNTSTLALNGELEATIQKTIASVKFPILTIPAGPLPIIITSGVDLRVEGKVAGSVSLEAKWAGQSTQDYGFRYSDSDGMKNISTKAITESAEPTFSSQDLADSVNGKLEGSIGPSVEFWMKIYDAAGPTLAFGFQIGGEAETKLSDLLGAEPKFEVTQYIEGNVKIGVEFEIPIIGEKLLSITVMDAKQKTVLGTWSKSYALLFPGNPIPTKPVTASSILAGDNGNTHALMADGTVRSWGANQFGQLGDGTSMTRVLPVAASGLKGVQSLVAGSGAVFAVMKDGTVQGWGNSDSNKFLDGVTKSRYVPAPVPGLKDVASMAVGANHNMYVVKKDGTVWSWGYNRSGILGSDIERPTPTKIGGLSGITTVSVGARTAVALDKDGNVWSWGWNWHSALGVGTDNWNAQMTPTRVKVSNIVSVSAGQTSTHAVDRNGAVWSWGWDPTGAIGIPGSASENGLGKDFPDPVKVPGISNARQVTSFSGAVYVVAKDGQAWAWGSNYGNKLGVPNIKPENRRETPAVITGLTGVTAMSGGAEGAGFAVKSDGTVWSWGLSYAGALGNGKNGYQSLVVPTQVTILK